MSDPVVIIAAPARRPGCYLAYLDGETEPLCTSRAPFLAAARALQARGFAPGVQLVMRRDPDGMDCLKAPLGIAAGLRVKEGDDRSPCFAPYSEFRTDKAPEVADGPIKKAASR
jgi:hypothetical protein